MEWEVKEHLEQTPFVKGSDSFGIIKHTNGKYRADLSFYFETIEMAKLFYEYVYKIYTEGCNTCEEKWK